MFVHFRLKRAKTHQLSRSDLQCLHTKTVLIMTCLIPSWSKAELALGFFLVVVFLGLHIDSWPIYNRYNSWEPFFWNVVVKIPFAVDNELVSNGWGFSTRIFFLIFCKAGTNTFLLISWMCFGCNWRILQNENDFFHTSSLSERQVKRMRGLVLLAFCLPRRWAPQNFMEWTISAGSKHSGPVGLQG